MPSEVQTERVLVVPTALFHELGHFQGFSRDIERYLRPLLESVQASYRPRHEVEEDPGFKQLIPYVLFRHTDSSGEARLFQYTRGKGQGEGRLHSKRSVGIGGHISEGDSESTAGAYHEGMRRELAEEIHINTPFTDQCVGLINDDESEVGRVHLGVVHLVDVEQPAVAPREADILESGFQPVAELLANLDRFETWSQICLKALFGEFRAMNLLETPRLALRRFSHADAEALGPILADPEVMRFSASGPIGREDFFAKTLPQYLASYDDDLGIGRWAIVHKPSGELIGFCGLMTLVIADHKEIETGYRLARAWWGRGLATEAVVAVRDYAFDRIGLARLVAIIDPDNGASRRVAEKAGFRYEKDVRYFDRQVQLFSLEKP